ncbi:MAG: 16S rRNA (cytosine(967)-C(5))-methyltransferase RsmB [Betaproteobacteria bacterium]
MQIEQQQAALAVRHVFAGMALPSALAAVDDGSELRGRTLVQELAYGTLRHWGRYEALTRALAAKPIADGKLAALVAVALYQLDHTSAPPFAIVDRAVEAAALIARPQAKALVNAMLRRYLRERDALNAQVVAASPVALWSYPRWWIGRVEADHPQHWQQILAVGNERPPLSLRINRRVSTRETLLARFAAEGVTAIAAGAQGMIVDPPLPVTALPGFAEGAFSVQDLGAQLAALLLAVGDGMRVLDACAAPGGKASNILELADVELVALDRDEARLVKVRENFARLKLAHRENAVVVGDAGQPYAWWDGRRFDRILVDVPCTASGIVRRHPDAKWLRRKSDLTDLAVEQRRILKALWPLLTPGGLLLYVTCSVFAGENEARVRQFMAETPDALRETLIFDPEIRHDGGQLLPSGKGTRHNQDGFFYALLRKV